MSLITTVKNENLIGIKDGVAVLVKDYKLVAVFFFDLFPEFVNSGKRAGLPNFNTILFLIPNTNNATHLMMETLSQPQNFSPLNVLPLKQPSVSSSFKFKFCVLK